MIAVILLFAAAEAVAGEPGGKSVPASAQSGVTTQRFGAISLADLNDEFKIIEQRVASIQGKLDFINKEYVIPQTVGEKDRFERRVARAELLILFKDYPNAAIILYDLVEDPANISRPGYYDAMNLLADALYNEKNFFGSKRYYQNLLAKGGQKYFTSSLKRLVEIAGETGSFDGLEDYFSLARQIQASDVSSEIYYVLGRSLFRRGDMTRAMETFQNVKEGSQHYLQSRYLTAAVLIKKGKYDEAIDVLRSIVKNQPAGKAEKMTQDLAYMAMGRVYYEQGKFTEAADTYQHVDRQSEFFEESVYEIAWIYIKKGEYKKALDAIEIMLLSSRDDPVLLQARLLYGNLLLKLGKYEEAEQAFQEITDKYGSMKEDMAKLLAKQDDPSIYFDRLAGEGIKKVEAQKAIPDVVIQWTELDKNVSTAMGVVKELDVSRKTLDESFHLADKMLSVLGSESRINMFPVLKEARVRVSGIKMELDEVRRSLSKIEDTVASEVADPADQAKLKKAREKREALEKQVEAMPKTPEEYQMRIAGLAGRMQTVEQVIFRMGIELDGMKAQLTAIDKWYYETRGSGIHEPGEEQLFHGRIQDEWNSVKQYEAQMKTLLSTVNNEKASMGFFTDMAQDDKIRQGYRQSLDEEQKTTDSLRSRFPADTANLTSRMDAITAKLKQLYGQLEKFDANINTLVSAKAGEEREKIQVELKLLDQCKAEADAIHGDTESLVGRIAYNGFRQVQRKIFDLILQADVGVIDVVWRQKEDVTKKIQKLQTELDRELRSVNEDYAELNK
ncbi:MAG: CDC27 family protein [Myxococcota bacterium]